MKGIQCIYDHFQLDLPHWILFTTSSLNRKRTQSDLIPNSKCFEGEPKMIWIFHSDLIPNSKWFGFSNHFTFALKSFYIHLQIVLHSPSNQSAFTLKSMRDCHQIDVTGEVAVIQLKSFDLKSFYIRPQINLHSPSNRGESTHSDCVCSQITLSSLAIHFQTPKTVNPAYFCTVYPL